MVYDSSESESSDSSTARVRIVRDGVLVLDGVPGVIVVGGVRVGGSGGSSSMRRVFAARGDASESLVRALPSAGPSAKGKHEGSGAGKIDAADLHVSEMSAMSWT